MLRLRAAVATCALLAGVGAIVAINVVGNARLRFRRLLREKTR